MLKFPWKEETHFIEKLWAMYNNNKSDADIYLGAYRIFAPVGLNKLLPTKHQLTSITPKLHTIRNKSDRYKEDQYIQPFIWTYKPYKKNPNALIPAQFDFMPELKIVSKQSFEITYVRNNKYPELNAFLPIVVIDGGHFYNPLLNIDKGMKSLAVNDGFKDAEHFFKYFDKPVKDMEIRHFTNLKY